MIRAIVLVSFVAVAYAKVSYDGYQGYLVTTSDDEAIHTLETLKELGLFFGVEDHPFLVRPFVYVEFVKLKRRKVLVLLDPSTKRPTEVAIPPEVSHVVLKHLTDAGLSYTLIYEDLQEKIDGQLKENRKSLKYAKFRSGGKQDLTIATYFPTYTQAEDWMIGLTVKFSKMAKLFDMGQSVEGRKQLGIKISTGGSNKEVIWLDAGIHAREWATVPTVLYFATKLLLNYDASDPAERTDALLNKYDFYIMPIVNPDGYVYTHTEDRLWRKNRRLNDVGCYGVDLNRNFGHKWGVSGVSRFPCDDSYLGPFPFSEPETQNMRDFLLKFKDRIALYFSVHAYGQLLFFPWAYSNYEEFEAEAEHERIAKIIRNKIFDSGFGLQRKSYSVGKAGDLIYNAAGGTFDWAYAEAGAKYAFVAELSPSLYARGFLSGFEMSTKDLPGVAEEFYQGLFAAIKAL